MKKLFLLCLLFSSMNAFATHNIAGDINIEQIGALTVRATITTYTPYPVTAADRPALTLYWGDGSNQVVTRTSSVKITDINFTQSIYETTHTFSGLGKYTLYMTDLNRNGGILNVNFPNSDLVAFHLQATVTLVGARANGQYNRTPELRRFPLEGGFVGEPFGRFPDAFDADGDSLAFRLITPLQGLHKNVLNYRLPSLIAEGDSNKITFDEKTGNFEWKNPQRQGTYTVAFQVISYRNKVAIDTIMRDMNIVIRGGITSLQSVDSQDFIKMSPNPIYTEGVLDINPNFGQHLTLEIINTLGQIVERANLRNEKNYTIRRKDWSRGVYFVHLKSETRQTVLKIEVL